MNKTIKVIELLNKIANEEEMPKRIRIGDLEFKYDEEINTYFNTNKNSSVKGLVQDWLCNTVRLNNTVEIIEESKEIDIQAIEELELIDASTIFTNQTFYILEQRKKINELVQAVKQLNKK